MRNPSLYILQIQLSNDENILHPLKLHYVICDAMGCLNTIVGNQASKVELRALQIEN